MLLKRSRRLNKKDKESLKRKLKSSKIFLTLKHLLRELKKPRTLLSPSKRKLRKLLLNGQSKLRMLRNKQL